MYITWISVRGKNEMGAFFPILRNFHFKNHTSKNFSFQKLPKRHCLFKRKIHTLNSHCSKDPYILHFVLNCSFCEKVKSEF